MSNNVPAVTALNLFLEGRAANVAQPAFVEPVSFIIGPSFAKDSQKSDGWIDVRPFVYLTVTVEAAGGTFNLVAKRSGIDTNEEDLFPSATVSSLTELFSGDIKKYAYVKLTHTGSDTTTAGILAK